MVPLSWYLALSAVIFTIGAAGVFFKRNIIIILLFIELMLNAANIAFVAFSSAFAARSSARSKGAASALRTTVGSVPVLSAIACLPLGGFGIG